jgi:predicted phosphodiesterase
MAVAALYDIHGNLPALTAVLDVIREDGVDALVIGGDVIPGPMPRETLQLLLGFDLPVHFIHGNGELAILAQMNAPTEDAVTYWGTTSGAPPPDQVREVYRWTAQQLQPDDYSVLASWPRTVELEIDGLGRVLFCHGTPRSETEIFTRMTPAERLIPVFDGLDASVIVCGHTHMQFDRQIGATRVVNAGSIGMPFGAAGAHWVLLGPEVQLQQTSYDLARAAQRIRDTSYPRAEEFASRSVLHPPSEGEMLEAFARNVSS